MAAFDTTRTSYGVATAANRIYAFLADCAAEIIAWNDSRVTRNALQGLTDRELADIGLERCDIDSVASSNLIR